jgi:hypothetical protein
MLRIIAATRYDQAGFERDTLLGQSLKILMKSRRDIVSNVTLSNVRGLPEFYNSRLQQAGEDEIILFTHDDVWFDDWYLVERLQEALAHFAVVGVAGNRRRVPRQPAWPVLDENRTGDFENVAGSITHVHGGERYLNYFGPAPCRVRLLDGVFLAARVQTLRQANVAFDPRFRFHFYDVDFCRSCEQAGLEMGVWPIAITHASVGSYITEEWRQAYQDYLAKWGE